jgi:hypothetical protein
MKIKRMKTLSALLCIFNIIFCFIACVKEGVNCDSYIDSYYYLSDDFKGKIPYKGFDTLTFISNMGDTAILYCQGKNQNFDKESQNQTAADCGEAKHNFYEKIEFNFEGSNSKLNNMKIEFNSKYGRLNINIMNKLCYGNIAYFNNSSNYSDQIKFKNNSISGAYVTPYNDTTISVLYSYKLGCMKIKLLNNTTWLLN